MIGVVLEEDVVGLGAGEEVGEVGVFNGREGVEVEGDLAVELVFLEMLVELRDFVELVHVEAVYQGLP